MSKITIKRNKKFVCSLVPFYVYVNDSEVAKVKNGQETTFELSEGTYNLYITKLHYVDGVARNSGYGGAIGMIIENENKAKELNKAVLEVKNGKDIVVECESNAVDCVILSIN